MQLIQFISDILPIIIGIIVISIIIITIIITIRHYTSHLYSASLNLWSQPLLFAPHPARAGVELKPLEPESESLPAGSTAL